MSEPLIGALLLGLLFALFAAGLEVAFALGIAGLAGLLWLKGWTVGLGVISSVAWSTSTSFSFLAVPLFVFMSAILLHSGIGAALYTAVARWVSFLPGGLAVASVFACAIFAAVSGSSIATAATIGMIAVPEMEKRGYHRPLIYGSLASGGTLGILIPPSIPMIIYGLMTETSVGQLYIAGIVPGILLALLFVGYIIVLCAWRPELAPRAPLAVTWRERLGSFVEVAPVVALIFAVLGTMYLGVVTPTEAAAVGAFVSLALALWKRRLRRQELIRSFHETARTTCMVMLILICASIFSHVIALLGVPTALIRAVTGLQLPPVAVFGLIFLILIGVAYALEELSVMIIILPFLFPLITGLGFDPIWFGVIMVIWLEMGLITPPVGINLFVIQGLARNRPASEVILGATPFVFLMLLAVVILFVAPELALWLPRQMIPTR